MVIGSIGGALSELCKDFHFMQNAGCNGNQKEKNFKIKNYWSDFKIFWYKWPLYQSCSCYFDWLKNMTIRGLRKFFLC